VVLPTPKVASETDDGKEHFVVFGREEDHPYARRDPRNNYVQFNHKFVEEPG